MLSAASAHTFLWEISSGLVPNGASVRTFGRLSSYDLAESQATLTAQHDLAQHLIFVGTKLVEPCCAKLGSVYMVIGELEQVDGVSSVLQARVLTCVDGIDLPLLERAVLEQRKYLDSRGGPASTQSEMSH
ncbi:CST complex subunit TEN1 isoform X2 [Ambystoma mexicanum]|uniref:CST complex subunit TEN1 isoform X2 n=1 Tax=Ambystoma mexicanum TaxID=8296 RepID=UPI0037E7363A